MPSYKKHVLFSIIIALPFIHDIFYLSLAVIGASMVDMDHHVRKKDLLLLSLLGLLITIILYFLKIPFLIGLSLIVISIIFYVCKHRGFVHSIPGIITLSFLFAFFVFGFYSLFNSFNIDLKVYLIIISVILGIIILNKKLILPFYILVPIGIILTPNIPLNVLYVFFAFLIGAFSHIILDLFTPSGVRLFDPLWLKKFKKSAGIFFIILWIFLAFIFLFNPYKIILGF